jgi:hypothetical protein
VIEEDEARLLGDIGFAKIRVPVRKDDQLTERTEYEERTVSQLIRENHELYAATVEAQGLKVVEDGKIFLVPDIVARCLLRGTLWADLNIETIIKRIPGAERVRRRIASTRHYGLLIPNWLGDGDGTQGQ